LGVLEGQAYVYNGYLLTFSALLILAGGLTNFYGRPPVSYVRDFLPGLVLFSAGLIAMVASLTTALMTSVPERHAGLASAINNAIAEVGP